MNKLKAAVIGLGNIAPMHINSLKAIGISIVAVCDKRLEVATQFAEEIGCVGYDDYQKMFEIGGFDVLHVCLPHYLHAPITTAALTKGYHVLTEKPMATTVADAEKMIASAEKSGKILGVIFQNRYNPGVQLIKHTLESGALGKVKGGWFRVTWNRSGAYYTGSDWRGMLDKEGGGVAINQSIHSFDLMNYFLGNPTAVKATVANLAHPSIEVEDIAEGVITYGDSSISFFVNTFHPNDAPVSYELICEHGRAESVGERTTITWHDGRKKTAEADIDAQRQFGMKSYWGVSHIKQIQDFYESLASGTSIKIDGEEALRTQRLINGVYESSETGQEVRF